jgi:hypothetical protein
MSSTLQDFRPLRAALSSRGANQPSMGLPENARSFLSAPNQFFGVWQALQWPRPLTS